MPEPQNPKQPRAASDAFKILPPEPVIKTMPEKYIGAAAGKPPVIREIVETRQVAPPKAPPPKAPAKKANKRPIIIAAAAFVLLVGAGVAAYILLAPAAPVPPPVKNANHPVNTNVNTPPPPPPSPVCGNNVIEKGEQCDLGSQNGATGSTCSATCQTVEVKPPLPPNTGIDSDSDGLTDVEETTIYGTDPHNIDTDGDTFNDGNEVTHLYDPSVKAPAMLKDAKVMATAANQSEGYSVIVPAAWTRAGENTAQFLATAPTGEIFEVLVTAKPADQSLIEWYLAMSPGTSASDVERFKTLQGYDALRSPDRLTTYIDPGNGQLYTLTYSYDDKTTLEFRATYEAFVGGFALLK